MPVIQMPYLHSAFGAVFVLLTCVTRGQLPPVSRFNAGPAVGSGALPASAGAAPVTLQSAVQGIASFMQRFEQLQPQLRSIPQLELDQVVATGQQLHERFMELQEKMRAAEMQASTSAGVGVHLEEQVLKYHNDLALFVGQVEAKLGSAGPGRNPVLPNSYGNFGAAAAAGAAPRRDVPQRPPVNAGSMISPATDQRLQTVMNSVVQGMQRFEALHPKFRSLPQQVFQSIATRGQQLHEEFVVLQRRGVELAGDGNIQMTEADAATYAAQMEDFVSRQTAFVSDAEAQVQSHAGGLAAAGGGLPPARTAAGYGGMMGAQLPVPPAAPSGGLSGSPSQMPAAGMPGRMPSLSGASFGAPGGGASAFGGAASPTGSSGTGRITPATDQRLSAVIEKVVTRMQEFEALKPQLSRLPQQLFAQIAQHGQQLNDRFVGLQQRGASIAGDGSLPMLESDASAYTADMEAFQQDQAAFVDQAKQAVQSGGAGAGLGGVSLGSGPTGLAGANPGAAALGGATLGSGGLQPPPSAGMPSGTAAFGGSGLRDAPSASAASQPLGSAGLSGGFGGASFGRSDATSGTFGSSSSGASGFGQVGLEGATMGAPSSSRPATAGSLRNSASNGFSGGRAFAGGGTAAGSLSRSALASHMDSAGSKPSGEGNQDLQAGLLALGKLKLDTAILPDSRASVSQCRQGQGDDSSCLNQQV